MALKFAASVICQYFNLIGLWLLLSMWQKHSCHPQAALGPCSASNPVPCVCLHPHPCVTAYILPLQIGTWTPKRSSQAQQAAGGGAQPSQHYRRSWGVAVKPGDPAFLWAKWLAPVYSVAVANIETACRLEVRAPDCTYVGILYRRVYGGGERDMGGAVCCAAFLL